MGQGRGLGQDPPGGAAWLREGRRREGRAGCSGCLAATGHRDRLEAPDWLEARSAAAAAAAPAGSAWGAVIAAWCLESAGVA
eukprot:14102813-Alexandrium_andersonii.AAC.1